MADYVFTFTVRDVTSQRATAIRDRLTQRLADDGFSAESAAMSQITRDFRVVGVDVATSEVYDETVSAVNRAGAEQVAVDALPSLVVVMVRDVGV